MVAALPLVRADEPRLLAHWYATGQPAGLDAHLRRHGRPPVPTTGDRRASLIRAVTGAGLTGRGGAGYPTGGKLAAVAQRRGCPVVVANGMESEPASGKDELLLTVAPDLVFDGATLAAAAVGAREIHVCLPRNRPDQVRQLAVTLAERHRAGLDPVRPQVRTLPQGYVASESSALVNWLNGGPARPLATPPRSHEAGVRGRPTLVQNVETLAHLALIARYGPDWFRQAGSTHTAGTMLVTVSGAVETPGVHEIPGGTLISAILAAAGGSTRPPQAVLVGGYAGTWLPARRAWSVPLTGPDLAPLGASPGAGVLVALPYGVCGLIETARILRYLAAHGAQQCGPCRFGLPAVAEDFTALARGRPDRHLVSRLRHRLGLLPGRGACHHPDGAARLAASALVTFADEVVDHHAGRCGATDDPHPALTIRTTAGGR